MSTVAKLGGVALTLSPGVAWQLQYGVRPFQRTFITSTSRAEKILAKRGPLTLNIKADGYDSLVVRNLFALQKAPVDENNLGVVVVDIRWKLSRQAITRDYNVRRTTGDFRRIGDTLRPIQTKDVIADYQFRRATLNEGQPWKAKEILADILTELVGKANFKLGKLRFNIDIEGLILDRDRGDLALARVLSYLPGAKCFVDLQGRLRIVNSLDGSEGQAIKNAGSRYRALPGEVVLVDRRVIRPKTVHVQFEPEPEMRFDYDEDRDDPAIPSVTAERFKPGEEPRLLENVLPVTDPDMVVKGKTVTEGTWLPIQEWIDGVNAKDDAPLKEDGSKLPPINLAVVRAQYLNGFQLLRAQYLRVHLGPADLLWEQRIAALATHWRRTFRVLPQWMDKVRGIKAIRSSIVDQETGNRGKAEAYFDYFMVPSLRNLHKNAGHLNEIGFNVTGYNALLENAKSGPADIVVLDADSGIFSLVFRTDPWGNAARFAPGKVSAANAAIVAQTMAHSPSLLYKVPLEPGWKLAVVLTVSTAVPNNSKRMYSVPVVISDAFSKLGGVKVPGAADGPDWFIGISSGVETARFIWSDASTTIIEKAVFGQADWPKELLTNQAETDAVAKGTAARVHSLLIDRFEGEQFVKINPKILPTGSMSVVTHSILPSGAAITRMALPQITQAPDLYSLLPDGVRKILQKQVQQ